MIANIDSATSTITSPAPPETEAVCHIENVVTGNDTHVTNIIQADPVNTHGRTHRFRRNIPTPIITNTPIIIP